MLSDTLLSTYLTSSYLLLTVHMSEVLPIRKRRLKKLSILGHRAGTEAVAGL